MSAIELVSFKGGGSFRWSWESYHFVFFVPMRAETLSLSSSWCPRQMNSTQSACELVKTWEEVSQSWRLSKKDTTAKHKTSAGVRAEAWPADSVHHRKKIIKQYFRSLFLCYFNKTIFKHSCTFSVLNLDKYLYFNLKAKSWSALILKETCLTGSAFVTAGKQAPFWFKREARLAWSQWWIWANMASKRQSFMTVLLAAASI